MRCWLWDRPYSFLNFEKNSAVRTRFTLAHELGHIVLHRNPKNKENIKRREKEADLFASEFLFPSDKVINEITFITLDSLLPIKLKWGISVSAILRKCYDLELITDDRYTILQKQIIKRKWRIFELLDDVMKIENLQIFEEAFYLLIDNNILTKEDILSNMNFFKKELTTICCLSKNFFEEKLLSLKSKIKVIK